MVPTLSLKPRLQLALTLPGLLAAGLWLRFRSPAPEWLRDASGGILYVTALAFAIAFLTPRTARRSIALTALLLTCVVECGQLVYGDWVSRQPSPNLWRLALGTTFAWTDFPPYFAGAILAYYALPRGR